MPNWGGAAKGAASGASIGSFIPGIGTGIGAGIGGLIGLFTGGKKNDAPDKEDQLTSTMDLLRGNAGQLQQFGAQQRQQGTEALGPALQYLTDLAGNDPAARMDATRGDRGRIIDQYDTARKSAATFGARGGATNASVADSYIQQAYQTNDLMGSSRLTAAQALASLGLDVSRLGLSADALATQSLDAIIRAMLGQEGLDVQKRGQTMGMWGDIGQGAGSIIGGILGGGGFGGGKGASA